MSVEIKTIMFKDFSKIDKWAKENESRYLAVAYENASLSLREFNKIKHSIDGDYSYLNGDYEYRLIHEDFVKIINRIGRYILDEIAKYEAKGVEDD